MKLVIRLLKKFFGEKILNDRKDLFLVIIKGNEVFSPFLPLRKERMLDYLTKMAAERKIANSSKLVSLRDCEEKAKTGFVPAARLAMRLIKSWRTEASKKNINAPSAGKRINQLIENPPGARKERPKSCSDIDLLKKRRCRSLTIQTNKY